jgi:hypothetical protein
MHCGTPNLGDRSWGAESAARGSARHSTNGVPRTASDLASTASRFEAVLVVVCVESACATPASVEPPHPAASAARASAASAGRAPNPTPLTPGPLRATPPPVFTPQEGVDGSSPSEGFAQPSGFPRAREGPRLPLAPILAPFRRLAPSAEVPRGPGRPFSPQHERRLMSSSRTVVAHNSLRPTGYSVKPSLLS